MNTYQITINGVNSNRIGYYCENLTYAGYFDGGTIAKPRGEDGGNGSVTLTFDSSLTKEAIFDKFQGIMKNGESSHIEVLYVLKNGQWQ